MQNAVYGDSASAVQQAEQSALNSDRDYITALIRAAQQAQALNQNQQQINLAAQNQGFEQARRKFETAQGLAAGERQMQQEERKLGIEDKRVAGQNDYYKAQTDNWQNQAQARAVSDAYGRQSDYDQQASKSIVAMIKDNQIPSTDRLQELLAFQRMSKPAQIDALQTLETFKNKALYDYRNNSQRAETANAQLDGMIRHFTAQKEREAIKGAPPEPVTELEIQDMAEEIRKSYPGLELTVVNGKYTFVPQNPYYQFSTSNQGAESKPFQSAYNPRQIQ